MWIQWGKGAGELGDRGWRMYTTLYRVPLLWPCTMGSQRGPAVEQRELSWVLFEERLLFLILSLKILYRSEQDRGKGRERDL